MSREPQLRMNPMRSDSKTRRIFHDSHLLLELHLNDGCCASGLDILSDPCGREYRLGNSVRACRETPLPKLTESRLRVQRLSGIVGCRKIYSGSVDRSLTVS